jgi:predicted acylesterase/phospholipase RssA
MKYTYVLILFTLIQTSLYSQKSVKTGDPFAKRSGTAILLTGAAARIPQEAALLEELYNRGLLNDVVFISGVSSGALNAVILNGILSGRFTWDEYKDILFHLNNKDIFIQDGKRRLPVDSSPEKELFRRIVEEKLNYHTIGDLPFTTGISVTHLLDLDLKKKSYRLCSRKINEESDTTLNLVEIMMASCAFPIAFPPVRISGAKTFPDVAFVDGGVGEDHVPYHALLEFEKQRGEGVEKIYIISRKNDSIPDISEELKQFGINDKGRFDRIGISLDNILMKGIVKRLEAFVSEAPQMLANSYIYIPDFKEHFRMFSFDNMRDQYTLTSQWAKNNDPEPLKNFLLYRRSGERRNIRTP